MAAAKHRDFNEHDTNMNNTMDILKPNVLKCQA